MSACSECGREDEHAVSCQIGAQGCLLCPSPAVMGERFCTEHRPMRVETSAAGILGAALSGTDQISDQGHAAHAPSKGLRVHPDTSKLAARLEQLTGPERERLLEAVLHQAWDAGWIHAYPVSAQRKISP
jgi:hypothetical protein